MKRITLLTPRGPCAGVIRALEIIDKALEKYPIPIFVNHHIVHNEFVVEEYEKKGVIFCKTPEEVPENSVYIFSAHGVSPQFRKRANSTNCTIIDATCPLVHKVHNEAKKSAKEQYHILYIGHKNHPEALGVMGISEMTLIENTEQAHSIELSEHQQKKCTVLTQTTLSIDETTEIIKILQHRFPQLFISKIKDICYATQNRQEAITKSQNLADAVFVVGSHKSSNSVRLVETAKKKGYISALVPNIQAIPFDILENIESLAITSGASVPEKLTQSIVAHIQKKYPESVIEQQKGFRENIIFTTPTI